MPIDSQRALARELGVTETSVRRYVADPRWLFARTPPWPDSEVPRMQAWANNELQRPDGDSRAEALAAIQQSPERTLKLKYMLAKTNKLELEREIMARRYVKREDVYRAFLKRIFAVKRAFANLPEELAPLLAGKEEPEIRDILRERLTAVLNEFATNNDLPELDDQPDAGEA